MIEKEEEGLSIVQQCILLSICRSGIYYQHVSESELDLEIMLEIDKYYTLHPFYGTRRMSDYLKEIGYNVGRKAVRSYYIKMGIWAIYPKKHPNTSAPNKEHKIYPYLLRNLHITHKDQVWATDITYIPMPKGHMYLCAIIDLFTRKVLSWGVSNTMDTAFCIEVLKDALLQHGKPEIFNSNPNEFCFDTNVFCKNTNKLFIDTSTGSDFIQTQQKSVSILTNYLFINLISLS